MELAASDTSIFQQLINDYLRSWAIIDHRVDGWPLMSSVQSLIFLLLCYFAMVYFGPKWMSGRKPFHFPRILILYNFSLGLLNLYIVIQMMLAAYRLNYDLYCQLPNPEGTGDEEMRMVIAIYLYMLTKPIEWLDTLFIIIRKKNSQLSFLHVYHHSTVFIISWIVARWVPSGSTFFPLMLNSIVHVVMYNYYALTAFGPNVQKHLWWKKYLTMFQMAQFLVALMHSFQGVITGCQYVRWIQYWIVIYMFSFLVFFGMFYQVTYIVKKVKKVKASKTEPNKSQMEITKKRHNTVINDDTVGSRIPVRF